MRALIYNDDGWSSYMRYPAPMTPEQIERVTVGPLIGTGVKVYQFCALGGHAVNYRSAFLPRIGEMMDQVNTMHVWRMRETLRHLDTLDTDPLHIVSAACHRHGIACQFSLRMNDAHHTYKLPDGSWYFPELLSPWIDENPDALLPNRQLDYAHPKVHGYRVAQIKEILDQYDVDGIDLDFTRFKPWFRRGQEQLGMPRMTELVQDLRELTREADKTLSARFEYDPQTCTASGLDVEGWLDKGLFDQITLGGTADHTPDAPAGWWMERAHASNCKVYPGIEGQLHWIPSCGGGGTGIAPGRGDVDGYGAPRLEYVRAIAAVHYMDGADGISLFNFTCADGCIDYDLFVELADPSALEFENKRYIAAVWPWDSFIYIDPWTSRFCVNPGELKASYELRIQDDIEKALRCGRRPCALLTLDVKGINRVDDIEVSINATPLMWNGYHYNHYDHGCWNDTLQYPVPAAVLQEGPNIIALERRTSYSGFAGAIEVRKCILDVQYQGAFAPGRISGQKEEGGHT